MFATYTKDVTTRAYVYDMKGRLQNEIALPGLGSAGGFSGNHDDRVIFYTYTSFNTPPSTFKYDIATRKSTLYSAPTAIATLRSERILPPIASPAERVAHHPCAGRIQHSRARRRVGLMRLFDRS